MQFAALWLQRFSLRSLSSRVFTLYGAILIAFVVIGLTSFIRLEIKHHVEAPQFSVVMLNDVTTQAVRDSAIIGDYDTIKKILESSVQGSLFSEATFIGFDGSKVSAKGRPLIAKKAPRWLLHWTGNQFSAVNRNIAVGGKDYGLLILRFNADAVAEQLWSVIALAVALGVTSLVVGLILIRVALARWLGGLDRLQEFAAALGEGKLDIAHLKLDSAPTEIVKIANMFNKTAALVREREATRRELKNQKYAIDQHSIVSICDLAGNITYANDKLCEISGYSREELMGANVEILRSDVHPPEFYRQVWGCLKSGKVWVGETCNKTRSGSLFWVVSTIVPLLGENGTPDRYIAIRTDISESKQIGIERAKLLGRFRALAAELETKSVALERASQREVEIGNRIQQTLLVTPLAPGYAGLLVSAFSQASKGIDGDFLEVFQVGDHIVDIVVGDVMGKGVPAALLGAATKLQFSRSTSELMMRRSSQFGLPQPNEIVGLVNHAMAPHLQALDAFVTLAYLRIDVQANTVTWVGCGHEEPLLVSEAGDVAYLANQHTPIGLFVDETYQQESRSLMPGDALFLCSDGASDAIRPNGERLGSALVNSTATRQILVHKTPATALHALRRDLLLDEVKLADDLTIVMLMRHDLHKKIARLEVPLSLESLRPVRKFVAAQTSRLPEELSGTLAVAAIEIFTNVIRHTKNRVPDAPLELLIEDSANGIRLEFKYFGSQFDPPVDPPDTDFAAFPEGGFGLHIIQAVSDHVEYLHKDGVNTVRMWIDKAA